MCRLTTDRYGVGWNPFHLEVVGLPTPYLDFPGYPFPLDVWCEGAHRKERDGTAHRWCADT